jgi:hypothetical protein
MIILITSMFKPGLEVACAHNVVPLQYISGPASKLRRNGPPFLRHKIYFFGPIEAKQCKKGNARTAIMQIEALMIYGRTS